MALEDDVAILLAEVQAREPFTTSAQAGYDGDPNNPAAPPVLDNAPLGAWYHRSGTDTFYRKSEAGTWEEGGGGGGGPGSELDILYSLEPLDFSVDYNDVSAVDPPAGKFFSTQTEIDDFLSAEGATNFKHLQKIWDAIPIFVFHPITIEVAAGEQRAHADATSFAFDLSGKYMTGGTITINGAAPSTWTDVVAAQTVISHQVLDGVGDDFWNPWVRFAGTPFAGQNLKGLHAVLDTGQTCVIWSHDDNTLYLTQKLSPTPVDGVTTVRVCRPSTVLQNSVDGATYKGSSGCISVSNDTGQLSYIFINNMWLQSFGRTWHLNSSRSASSIALSHCLMDWIYEKDILGYTSGRGIQTLGTVVSCTHVSMRSRNDINDQNPYYVSGLTDISYAILRYCYTGGHRRHISISDGGLVQTYSSVFEEIGYQDYYGSKSMVTCYSGGNFRNQHYYFYEGKRTTFIAGSSDGNAFHADGTLNLFDSGFTSGVWFRGFTAPVIYLENDAGIDLIDLDPGLFNDPTSDDDANSDVGILVEGAGQRIRLNSNCEVRGTAGELSLGGVIGPYADLPTQANPLITQKLNIVSRD